jgi:hypothetical protein
MKLIKNLLLLALIALAQVMLIVQGGNALARVTGWHQPQPKPVSPVPQYRTA